MTIGPADTLGSLMNAASKKGIDIGIDTDRSIVAKKNGKLIDEQKPGQKEGFDDAAKKLKKRMEKQHVL